MAEAAEPSALRLQRQTVRVAPAEARGAARLAAAQRARGAARAVRLRVLLRGDEAAAGAGARAGRGIAGIGEKILKRVLAFVYNNTDVLQGEFRSKVGGGAVCVSVFLCFCVSVFGCC